MARKRLCIAPSFSSVSDAFENQSTVPKNPVTWKAFLWQCGLSHTSFTRLEVIDTTKFFLAKIKHGF